MNYTNYITLPQDLMMPGADYAELAILSVMFHFIHWGCHRMNCCRRCPWGHTAQAASHYVLKSFLRQGLSEKTSSTQSPALPATEPAGGKQSPQTHSHSAQRMLHKNSPGPPLQGMLSLMQASWQHQDIKNNQTRKSTCETAELRQEQKHASKK